MKIVILQIYNHNIKDYAQYSSIINMLYANQHNYKYVCWNHDLIPLEYSVYYNKLFAIYKVMNTDIEADWILYLDSDAIITNDTICIEDIITRHPNKDIILATDANGQNNGVILIKNCSLMKQYIRDCIEDARFYHTKTPEQSAMFVNISKAEYAQVVGWETMHFLNAYIEKYKDMKYNEPLWDEHSFIMHLQNLPNEQRQEIFEQFLKAKSIFYFIK